MEPDAVDEIVPEADGVSVPPDFFGPMVDLKVEGFAAFACREKAPRHCRTCAGSLPSKRSTVKKRSCEGMLRGGISHALRK